MNKIDYEFSNGRYVLKSDFITKKIYYLGRVMSIRVPKGFSWDGLTRPSFLKFLYNNDEPGALEGSCVHDYFYETKVVSRLNSDRAFYKVSTAHKYPCLKAFLAFCAVRIFGSKHYGTK